jgi:uncharacterized protein YycO
MFSIGFSRPKKQKLASNTIQLVLNTNYSHTYLVFDVKSTGQRVVYQATLKGVHCLEYETFKKDNIIIDEIYIKDEESRTDALRFCISHLGKPYSLLAIFAILFNIKFGDGKRSFICSELVARALKLPVNRPDLVTPRDIREYLENLYG